MPVKHFEHGLPNFLFQPGIHWIWLSMIAFAAACLLPAIDVLGPVPGWACLMMPYMPWWWSNPAYFIGILFYWKRRRRTAAVLGAISVLIALHIELSELLDNKLLPGCVMWVTSLQIFTLNAIVHVWIDRKNRLEKQLADSIRQ